MLTVVDQWEAEGTIHRLCENEDGALFLQYRSPLFGGSWGHIGSDAALYRLRDVIGERLSGGEQERSRIRMELLAWYMATTQIETFEAALDRICPKEG